MKRSGPSAHVLSALLFVAALGSPAPAAAQERLCDPSFEDCRTPLLALIRQERVGIDAAWWFMTDPTYATELVRKWREGVPIRVIVDTRANTNTPLNADRLRELRDAGIPMRQKVSAGILHWKAMIFAGQNTVQFSAANYSPQAFLPFDPYRNYTDEVIYFATTPSVVGSFMTKFDDLWTNTSGYSNYANVKGGLSREYPRVATDPELNFPPLESFRARAVAAYNNEQRQIDAIMFRITDRAHTDALIAAMARGVRVRLITDWGQYTDASRMWHAWNVDRLYKAGAQIRVAGEPGGRAHASAIVGHRGTVHQKSTLLYSQRMTIFGSSNWTSPSTDSQEEHNYFTTRSAFFQYFQDQFERKWNNSNPLRATETEPFVPLPPDRPRLAAPVDGATDLAASVTLSWAAGVWTHVYDIYFGTDPNPPLAFANRELGPSMHDADYKSITVDSLEDGVTYYWRVVAKTMADATESSEVRSFTVGGAPATGGPAPFGTIDTPSNGVTGVTGSIAITGWALDDVAVSAVRIMRAPVAGEPAGQVFVGNATLVAGARPDIAAAYPGYPNNTSAGWGYLLLTNMLPNQGDGVFTFYAYGDDASGNSTLLGSRTMTCANSTSMAPFGAIDTPGQGETVSGIIVNYGWVLIRDGARADIPGGGAVQVLIDGVAVGSPTGWTSRSDLSALFPSGYSNLQSAAAAFTIDTRTLSNGVHTIAWVVTATNGQSAGIGSRFFTVANGTR